VDDPDHFHFSIDRPYIHLENVRRRRIGRIGQRIGRICRWINHRCQRSFSRSRFLRYVKRIGHLCHFRTDTHLQTSRNFRRCFLMKKKWVLIGLLLVFLFTFPLYSTNYLLHIGIITLMFAFASQAWNIISGYSGQFSFGHAAFFGVGAYTSTVLLVEYNVNPWIGMFIGAIIAAAIAFVLGFLTFRYKLKGAYFSLTTLAFAEILRVFVKNTDFFRKTMGIMIPLDINPFWYQFQTRVGYYYTILILTIIITVIVYLISRSRLGFNLIAIRENEDAAQSLGVRTFKKKMIAITLSGGLSAF